MRLVRWDPYQELVAMSHRLNRTADDSYFPRTEDSFGAWAPPVDIFERQDHLAIRAEVPGLRMEDMDVRIENGVLTLRGERKQEADLHEENAHRTERVYGAFARSFTLPTSVDAAKVTAEVEAALGYRFASANLGSDWLMIDLAATATSKTVEVKRERISLRTPDGETVPLATQQEFGEAYGRLRADIERANVAADPLDYFPRGRVPCLMAFFTEPGQGLAYPSVWLDDRRVCVGRLFFAVPGGVHDGTYTLAIDLEESQLRIPFRLGGEG